MPNSEPYRLPATSLARLIEDGELTAEAVMQSCLERISEREPVVRAWAHLDPGQALAAARECDTGFGEGLLKGVPFGVKDITMPATPQKVWQLMHQNGGSKR